MVDEQLPQIIASYSGHISQLTNSPASTLSPIVPSGVTTPSYFSNAKYEET